MALGRFPSRRKRRPDSMRAPALFAVCVGILLAVGCDGRSPAPNRDSAESGEIAPAAAVDPLPSWNDGPAKTAISAFVARVTTTGGAEFVPASERIAVFDNDGTLWTEQPIYVQLAFALDRVRALVPQHPEWSEREPF